MDAFDLLTARKRITELIGSQVTDSRVLQTLRHQQGLIPQETELWDYKAEFGDDSVSRGKAVKHIVSFYNTFGGYLIYGVSQSAGSPVMDFNGSERLPQQQQLRDLVKAYTGQSIPVLVGFASLDQQGKGVGIVLIPKRSHDDSPVEFGKNGPEDKPGKPLFLQDTSYFRDMDRSVPIRTRDQWAFVFGRRSNPNIWELGNDGLETPTLDNTLPDQNLIFPWFVGRARILTELWRWLGNPFTYLKLLAGDGGKGKTSIAYEFSRQVCSGAPLGFERVLWLSAKRQRFVGQLDAYVPMPDADFADNSSFLERLADQCAITSGETQGASPALLKSLVRDALTHLPSLIVVDDVDSLDVNEQKTLLSTIQQLACHKGRFLVTTRMNFSFGPDMAISVAGLEQGEFDEFVGRTAQQFKIQLTAKNISSLRETTEGSPLFTESLLRLVRQGMSVEAASTEWKGRLGAEARNAALMKEIRSLTAESRRVLLACALLEQASISELKNVVEYVDQRMKDCVGELQALFLFAEPQIIDGEQRYSVSSNTQSLVIENRAELSNDPDIIERKARQLLRLRRGTMKVRSVGLAMSQAVAILRDERFDEAIATVRAALEAEPDNHDLLSTLGLCFLVEGKATDNPARVRDARDQFRKSYQRGQRKAKTFELWLESETWLHDWVGAEEVSGLAIKTGTEPRSEWLRRRATIQVTIAERQDASAPDLAMRKLQEAATDLTSALDVSTESDKIGFQRLLTDVHDRQWSLTRRKGSGIAELKLAVDTLKQFLERGDFRPENGARPLEILDCLLEAALARRPRSRGFKNLADQVSREAEALTRRVAEKRAEGEIWRPILSTASEQRQKVRQALKLDDRSS